MVAVAQSAERLVVVQEVAGSIPVSHPRWVGFELLIEGSPLEEAPTWPLSSAPVACARAWSARARTSIWRSSLGPRQLERSSGSSARARGPRRLPDDQAHGGTSGCDPPEEGDQFRDPPEEGEQFRSLCAMLTASSFPTHRQGHAHVSSRLLAHACSGRRCGDRRLLSSPQLLRLRNRYPLSGPYCGFVGSSPFHALADSLPHTEPLSRPALASGRTTVLTGSHAP